MSHTTTKLVTGTNACLALVKLTSYTPGGEQFTMAEFGLTGAPTTFIVFQTAFDLVPGGNTNAANFLQYAGAGLVKLMDIHNLTIESGSQASLALYFLVFVWNGA